MARSELAPATPRVLQWARESMGVSLEEAAKRADVGPERVAEWESGKSEPTLAKLRELAKLYQRPLSVFFLPEPPADFDTARDFRRLPDSPDHGWSRPLHKVFRRAREQQEIALELLEDDGITPQPSVPQASIQVDPELAASRGRSALAVDLADQIAWRTPEEALSAWVSAVEGVGVLVLRTSEVRMEEMRGFSLPDPRLPVVVINALDWPRGQIFTLAHEFAHLMLREGGLCDLLEPDEADLRRVETWCNATSGALLMPAAAMPVEELESNGWDDAVLDYLSRRFGVSQEAALRRLVTLGFATWREYLDRRSEYLAAYHEQREREKERRRDRKSPGGPPPHRMVIRDRGRPYVRLVLDALHDEEISASTASEFLGLKLRHFEQLEQEA